MSSEELVPWTDEELYIKVGQLFIVGFHGQEISEDIKTLITTYKVGSVILFQRNIANKSKLLMLTNSLQDLAKSAGHTQDLFIAIDQENGLVSRIKPPVTAQLPGAMALGATGDTFNAFKVASATAKALKSLGINMNYAPVADINSEPKNPVIGVRSPSDDPETVGRFVSAQIRGLKAGGVVPCVKHFPGHGDTTVDSHYGLPVIMKSEDALEDCELLPFRRAVSEGVDAVMTAHINMPAIGNRSLPDDHPSRFIPASLNPEVIKILRLGMNFQGLIISDCLEMEGVRATYGTEKSAVMALKAGTDCVMICHTIAAQIGAIELVVQAIKEGTLSQKDIETSVGRVRQTKNKHLLSAQLRVPNFTLEAMEAMKKAQSALASEIYPKSTTLVRSALGVFPIAADSITKVVFISPGKLPLGGGAVSSGEGESRGACTPASYIDILKTHSPSATEIRFFDSNPLSTESEKRIDEADIVIFASRNAGLNSYQKELGLSLGKRLGDRLITIATCDPYDFLEDTEEIKNYIATYEPTIPAFDSASNIIFGLTKPVGKLTVKSQLIKHDIRAFNNSEEDLSHVQKLWDEIFPTWRIQRERLRQILKPGQHHHHRHGFCLSYLGKATGSRSIALIGVQESHRGQGIGTALLTQARKNLRDSSRTEELRRELLAVRSVFPRLWPGIPLSVVKENRDWFLHRGFRNPGTSTARDLYRSIKTDVATPEIMERVGALPLTFSPWSAEMYDECMNKQEANFSHNKDWIATYETLAKLNLHHEVMVAFDLSGAQVGWTLMCGPDSPISSQFAFLELLPSGKKTGLIACVGVDSSARGKSVGLGMLVRAMEDMRRRGIEGVFIDWVVIRGFYEKLGFEVWWEYQDCVW